MFRQFYINFAVS